METLMADERGGETMEEQMTTKAVLDALRAANEKLVEADVAAILASPHPRPARWAAVTAGFSSWTPTEAAHLASGCERCARYDSLWKATVEASPPNRAPAAVDTVSVTVATPIRKRTLADEDDLLVEAFLATGLTKRRRKLLKTCTQHFRRYFTRYCELFEKATEEARVVLAQTLPKPGPGLQALWGMLQGFAYSPDPVPLPRGFSSAGAAKEFPLESVAGVVWRGRPFRLPDRETQSLQLVRDFLTAECLIEVKVKVDENASSSLLSQFLVLRPAKRDSSVEMRMASNFSTNSQLMVAEVSANFLCDADAEPLWNSFEATRRPGSDLREAPAWQTWAAKALASDSDISPEVKTVLQKICQEKIAPGI
jgi:hypothetical protein